MRTQWGVPERKYWSDSVTFLERLRSLGWFLAASAWFLFSDLVAQRAASGLTQGEAQEPLYRWFLLFLLVLGYGLMSRFHAGGSHADRQEPGSSARSLGLERRPGWGREIALGAALGWAGAVACVLPAALSGDLVVTLFTSGHQWGMLVLEVMALAAGTLAVEVAFRGYPFQRLVEAMGPGLATLFMAAIYAIWWTHTAPATTATMLVTFLLGWVLALAYLRTRALWVSWGLHFAWAAVLGIALGLPVAGPMSYSPIVVTNSRGAGWVAGGLEGPEGSAFGVMVAFLLLFAVVSLTADLKHKYGYERIVPGGIPVDLDAAARQQHEAAMGAAAAQEPTLVQIQGAGDRGQSSEISDQSSENSEQ